MQELCFRLILKEKNSASLCTASEDRNVQNLSVRGPACLSYNWVDCGPALAGHKERVPKAGPTHTTTQRAPGGHVTAPARHVWGAGTPPRHPPGRPIGNGDWAGGGTRTPFRGARPAQGGPSHHPPVRSGRTLPSQGERAKRTSVRRPDQWVRARPSRPPPPRPPGARAALPRAAASRPPGLPSGSSLAASSGGRRRRA